MLYAYVLNRGQAGVRSPADRMFLPVLSGWPQRTRRDSRSDILQGLAVYHGNREKV
jgi:hypothetical protein